MFNKYASVKSVCGSDAMLQKCISGAKRNDENVVEIIDNETGEGNRLLINLLVNCILPQSHGGSSVNVFYFDLNQHFDFLSLVSVMEEKTKAAEPEIRDWMKKFHIVRCSDMEQLIITLYSIEPLIANSKIPVKLIILDGLSTFYWNEQCAGGFSQYLKEQNYRRLVKALDAFMKKYHFSILVRTLEIFGPAKNGNGEYDVDPRNLRLYGDFWKDFVTHRFVLKTTSTKDFQHCESALLQFTLECFAPESFAVNFFITNGGIVE